ncbi:MAG: HTH domain-containing protein [Thaumarchaeota archaeon]|nr:HTH domain-containing protein [Nitrososphaerota archaeon]
MTRVGAFKDAARRVLRGRAPMHFQEIADRAMGQRLVDMDKSTIHSYMGATLDSTMSEHGSDSAIVSPSPGHYEINPRRADLSNMSSSRISPISRLFRRAAFSILGERHGTLHYVDIAEIAMSEGLIRLTESTIHRCMGAILHDDIRHNGASSEFINPRPTLYGLNPSHARPSPSPAISPGPPESPTPPKRLDAAHAVSVSCVGRGGEHLVASKLNFLGYDVQEPSIDRGIDLIATKDGKSHNFQVKTSTSPTNVHRFYITKSTFEKTAPLRPLHVFVARRPNVDEQEDCLVVPYEAIRRHISRDCPPMVGNKYVVMVAQKEDTFSLVPGGDITEYRGGWDAIR